MASIESLRSGGRTTSTLVGAIRPGHPGRAVRRLAALLGSGALVLGVAAPTALAAEQLLITTPYPAVVVAPGAHVSFNVDVRTPSPERVALTLTGAPATWKATLHGGGFVIDAVQTSGTDASTNNLTPTTIRVDVDVPTDATGTTNMILKGSLASGAVVELPLQVRVEANATGDLTINTDFPSLRGPSSQTFNFNLTLKNDTAEDLTFSVNATGPVGWTVTANLTGQSQAASAIVKAGSTSGVTVSATPAVGTAAGTYDLQVVAVAGERNITGSLQVDVTGTYTLGLATESGRLNGQGDAGSASPLAVTVTNSGTAAITNVKLTSSAPTGWEVTFDTPTIDSIGPNETKTVNATVKPSNDAIAGDYTITVTAAGDQSTRDSMDIRYTVQTSLLWGVIGVALIVVVVGAIWWVFQRYGRR